MNVCEEYTTNGRCRAESISAATEDELIELKSLVDTNTVRIGAQLLAAKGRVITEGIYSDPGWYARATTAKKVNGQLSQRIQSQLSKRHKARTEMHRQTFATRLLDAMNIVLSPEQKRAVLLKAEELKE